MVEISVRLRCLIIHFRLLEPEIQRIDLKELDGVGIIHF